MSHRSTCSPIERLPLEIRLHIWGYVLGPATEVSHATRGGGSCKEFSGGKKLKSLELTWKRICAEVRFLKPPLHLHRLPPGHLRPPSRSVSIRHFELGLRDNDARPIALKDFCRALHFLAKQKEWLVSIHDCHMHIPPRTLQTSTVGFPTRATSSS